MHPKVGFIGLGEVGSSYARALVEGGLPQGQVRALYLGGRPGADPARAAERARQAGVAFYEDPAAFAAGLELVVSAVSPQGAQEVAAAIAGFLAGPQLFLDVNSVGPKTKATVAQTLEARGVLTADGAIMGAPASSGRITLTLSGPCAAEAAGMLAPYGAQVDVVGDRVGMAATLKMARSVVMKGFAMLLIEALWAARRAGVEEQVLRGIDASIHQRDFDNLVQRFVCGSLQHAGRRVGEMEEVEAFLEELGVPAEMTRATKGRLRYLASRDPAWHERPFDRVDLALDALLADADRGSKNGG